MSLGLGQFIPNALQRRQQAQAAQQANLAHFTHLQAASQAYQQSLAQNLYNQPVSGSLNSTTTGLSSLGGSTGSGGSSGGTFYITFSNSSTTATTASASSGNWIATSSPPSFHQYSPPSDQLNRYDSDSVIDYAINRLPIQDLILILKKKRGKVDLWKGNKYDFNMPDGSRIETDHSGNYRIDLLDGTSLFVENNGSFRIEDAMTKVRYKAAPERDFNPFINASDKLEGFIDYCATHGVTKEEMAEIPVKLFINWLIIEAAKADREATPDLPLLPAPKEKQECVICSLPVLEEKWKRGLRHCSVSCYEKELKGELVAA